MRPTMATVWNRGARGWFVRWKDDDGRERARKCADEQEARDVAERLNRAEAREKLLDASAGAGPLPLDELARAWRDRYAALRSKRTQVTDWSLVERIANHFGSTDVRDPRESHVVGFSAAILGEGKSGHTAANALSTLRRVVNLAGKDGLCEPLRIDWSAVIKSARSQTLKESAGRDAWSTAETEKILQLAHDHAARLHPPLVAAFHTGMRRGEIIALRWEDVDFSASLIHVRRSAASGGGTKVPKAGSGRLVPMSATLSALLARHRMEQRARRLKRLPMPEWVFCSPRWKFWQERNFSRKWAKLREDYFAKAGVRELKLHCTRHTFITRALEAGTPASVVAGWVGASVVVIEKHYAHVIPSRWSVDFIDGKLVHRPVDQRRPGGA
jgi:integrase